MDLNCSSNVILKPKLSVKGELWTAELFGPWRKYGEHDYDYFRATEGIQTKFTT